MMALAEHTPNPFEHREFSQGALLLPCLTQAPYLSDSVNRCKIQGIFMTKLTSGGTRKKKAAQNHEDLVACIAINKDRAAFRTLFDYFAPRLKSYLLNFGLNSQKAEDLAQEVMLILWQKADKFDPTKAKVSTWLFRVARNKFIDLSRKQKYPEVNADDHLSQMKAAEQTDKPVEEAQTQSLISAAMDQLKPDQQQVIRLSFFEEMSHGQIAEHLQLPLGTVKSRIRMSFQMLRRVLGEFQ